MGKNIASFASKCNKMQYVNTVLTRHTTSKECWTNLREASFLKLARVHQLKVFVHVGASEALAKSSDQTVNGEQVSSTTIQLVYSAYLFDYLIFRCCVSAEVRQTRLADLYLHNKSQNQRPETAKGGENMASLWLNSEGLGGVSRVRTPEPCGLRSQHTQKSLSRPNGLCPCQAINIPCCHERGDVWGPSDTRINVLQQTGTKHCLKQVWLLERVLDVFSGIHLLVADVMYWFIQCK